MDTETVTLELPPSLYRTARHVADATHQPLDVVLQTGLSHALPPLDDVPETEAAMLAALALLDDGALWRAARTMMPAGEQAELHALLDQQAAGELTPLEGTRLEQLLDTYGRLMVRKAHAYLLLARRGYRVPPQENAE